MLVSKFPHNGTEYYFQKLPKDVLKHILSYVENFDEESTTVPTEHWVEVKGSRVCFVDVPQYPEELSSMPEYSIDDEIRDSDIIYLVYDITDIKSFQDIKVNLQIPNIF